jgi:hypothetical protein
MKDPLYTESDDQTERLAADKTAMLFAQWIVWLKIATGFLALALIAAIWLFWRFG